MIVLYILLFILFLSVLIIIHELGHFTAAKIFKVYCFDFSIGFGPALIHKKRKDAETYFSLRVIPFGGFVSMYGESDADTGGLEIDHSRSIEGIKKWKKAIILFAGVFMNAILALILFFVSAVSFPSEMAYLGNANIKENSIAAVAGLVDGDAIYFHDDLSSEEQARKDNFLLIDLNSIGNEKEGRTTEIATYLNANNFTNYSKLDSIYFLTFFNVKNVDGVKMADFASPYALNDSVVSVTMNIQSYKYPDKEHMEVKDRVYYDHVMTVNKDVQTGMLESFGYSIYYERAPGKSFGEGIVQSFKDFGESSTLIVKTLGSLFTSPSSWQNVGGIVAIGFESTSLLQNFGWGKFLYLWAAISVNLAIVNLLPFPGLDGWQLLVLVVEAISHKKIPDKVKGIVSIVGLAILFGLMAVILFKDLFTYVFIRLL